jgi:hypothetical protein
MRMPILNSMRRSAVMPALRSAVLHVCGAAHCINHAAKLDEVAVPGAFDSALVMRGDRGIDQIAAQSTKTR